MKQYFFKSLLAFLLCTAISSTIAQSLEHPVIWTTAAEKADVLAKVDNYAWAQTIITKAKKAIDDEVDAHITNPESILNTIPELSLVDDLIEADASDNNRIHSKVLNYASYAAMVYYVTDEEKYAQFAADILWYYIEETASKTPETTAFSGSHFYDPRSGYPNFAIAYDFMVNYLKLPTTRVYQKSSGNMVSFDNTEAQKAVYNIAMNALNEHGGSDSKYGEMVSNHPVLRAPGVLFTLLCVEDDMERERMFDVFWNVGTRQQNSFTKTILPMFGEQGIWPESVSYGFMPNITMILNVVDRIKPELNVMDDYMSILDGNFLFDNLRLPNRRFVRYGDSDRDVDGTQEIYNYTMNMAHRRGLEEYEQKATVALRQAYDSEGGYDPDVPIYTYDNYKGYAQLFWGYDIPTVVEGEIDFQKPTVVIKHAGIALQRNYVTNNNEEYGLCGIIGGAHYVHAHCTGISMELYGCGYVMGANGGLPKTLAARSDPEHTDYFMRHAGNNTIIVNGTTHGIQNGWGANMYLYQNTTVNIASEPKHLEDPISPNFSFATQLLEDEVNNCDQQRTLSTIRTSTTTAYYFDMFRSKSLATNNFHDYIYHNLGDEMHLFDSNNQEMSVTATTRYQNDIGDLRKSPGWLHYDNTKVTAPTSGAVKARFDINYDNRYMHMIMPQGTEREYTEATSFPTREAKNDYLDKETQIIAIRQQGEAWNRPYVTVFEPSASTEASVQSVENIEVDGVVVGAKVVSLVNGEEIEDLIICLDKEMTVEIPEHYISFTGRFAIIRKQKQTETLQTVTLYIGEGSSLRYAGNTLVAGEDKKEVEIFYGVPTLDENTSFNLTTRVLGDGGSITVEPNKTSYLPADQITVTAVPEEGYVLDEWLGDAKGIDSDYQLTFFSDMSVMARFRYADYYTLEISAENGTVTSSVEGNEHPERKPIELTAIPNDRYEFVSWSGDVESTENPLSIRLDSTMNVVANFRELELYKLTVNSIGNGKVYLSPDQEEYLVGTEVTLFAQANGDDSFVNWTGDYASDFSTIYVTVDSNMVINANFTGASGIADSPLKDTAVYPNPNTGVMQLTTSFSGECSYTILDITGNVLQQGIFVNKKNISIDESGYYFIQLETPNSSKVLKVLVGE